MVYRLVVLVHACLTTTNGTLNKCLCICAPICTTHSNLAVMDSPTIHQPTNKPPREGDANRWRQILLQANKSIDSVKLFTFPLAKGSSSINSTVKRRPELNANISSSLRKSEYSQTDRLQLLFFYYYSLNVLHFRQPVWTAANNCKAGRSSTGLLSDRYNALKHAPSISSEIWLCPREVRCQAAKEEKGERESLNKYNDNALWDAIAKHKVQSLNRWLRYKLKSRTTTSEELLSLPASNNLAQNDNNKTFLLSMHTRVINQIRTLSLHHQSAVQ